MAMVLLTRSIWGDSKRCFSECPGQVRRARCAVRDAGGRLLASPVADIELVVGFVNTRFPLLSVLAPKRPDSAATNVAAMIDLTIVSAF